MALEKQLVQINFKWQTFIYIKHFAYSMWQNKYNAHHIKMDHALDVYDLSRAAEKVWMNSQEDWFFDYV